MSLYPSWMIGWMVGRQNGLGENEFPTFNGAANAEQAHSQVLVTSQVQMFISLTGGIQAVVLLHNSLHGVVCIVLEMLRQQEI